MKTRTFLLLQAPPGPFARWLAKELKDRGNAVFKINVCAADGLQWIGLGGTSYRGSFANWPMFLTDFIQREGVTDILYYGDRLPYHRVALEVADKLGIRTTVYEFGYLRPDWITLERRGMSAQSHFPVDADQIVSAAQGLPEPDLTIRYTHPFGTEAFFEAAHHLYTYFSPQYYPRYQSDTFYNPLLNYLSYIPRLLAQRRRNRRAEERVAAWINSRRYFLVPLQMQNDYQLRANSPFRHQKDVIDLVLRSLAACPDKDLSILFKIHPLDNGWERWSKVVGRKASELGLEGRVTTLDGGHLPTMIDHAIGVVLVNSTVGIQSLLRDRPTKVLGAATFDIPRLTHQGPLDTFWTNPDPPDREVRKAFFKLLVATIQIKGSFYNRQGIQRAVQEIADRFEHDRINEPGAFCDPPPRLARARELGLIS